jgi:hypothetical protein
MWMEKKFVYQVGNNKKKLGTSRPPKPLAPDDGHEDARNILSCIKSNRLEKLLHLVG